MTMKRCVPMHLSITQQKRFISLLLKDINRQGRRRRIQIWLEKISDPINVPPSPCYMTAFPKRSWWVIYRVLHHMLTLCRDEWFWAKGCHNCFQSLLRESSTHQFPSYTCHFNWQEILLLPRFNMDDVKMLRNVAALHGNRAANNHTNAFS